MKVYNDGTSIAYVSHRKNDFQTEVTIMQNKEYKKMLFDTDRDAHVFLAFLGYQPTGIV